MDEVCNYRRKNNIIFLRRELVEDMCTACLNSMLDVDVELNEELDDTACRGWFPVLLCRLGSLLLCFACLGPRDRSAENTDP